MSNTGKILFYDQSGEEGIVVDDKTGQHYYLHGSAIVGDKDKLIKGQQVEFSLYTNLYMSQVDSLKIKE
jgi:cold shock CspA family protein